MSPIPSLRRVLLPEIEYIKSPSSAKTHSFPSLFQTSSSGFTSDDSEDENSQSGSVRRNRINLSKRSSTAARTRKNTESNAGSDSEPRETIEQPGLSGPSPYIPLPPGPYDVPMGYRAQPYAFAQAPAEYVGTPQSSLPFSPYPSERSNLPASPFVSMGYGAPGSTQWGYTSVPPGLQAFSAAPGYLATPGMSPYPPLPGGPLGMEPGYSYIVPGPAPPGASIQPGAPYMSMQQSFPPTSGGPGSTPYTDPNLLASWSGSGSWSTRALPRRSSSLLSNIGGAATPYAGTQSQRADYTLFPSRSPSLGTNKAGIASPSRTPSLPTVLPARMGSLQPNYEGEWFKMKRVLEFSPDGRLLACQIPFVIRFSLHISPTSSFVSLH